MLNMTGHRKKLKRFHEPGHFHELTFSCYKRMNLLTNDVWRKQLAAFIDEACTKYEMELNAFVFMPNHMHLLVYPTNPNPEIGKFLASFKQPFSKFVKQVLESNDSKLLEQLTVRERPGKHCFRFWQEGGGYDRNLFEPDSIEGSINYIHMNPVKKNFCKKAIDWKWSSVNWYLNSVEDSDLPTLTKPKPELFNVGGVQTSRT